MLVSYEQMVKPCWTQELVEGLTVSVRKEQLWLWGGGQGITRCKELMYQGFSSAVSF